MYPKFLNGHLYQVASVHCRTGFFLENIYNFMYFDAIMLGTSLLYSLGSSTYSFYHFYYYLLLTIGEKTTRVCRLIN